MVTNDIIKLNVIVKLDIDIEVKNQLSHDNIKTLKRKKMYCLIQAMKNLFTLLNPTSFYFCFSF